MSDECGTMSTGRDGVTELVETMLTADGLRLAAYGPDKDRTRFVKGSADSFGMAVGLTE
jgi:hypothetical protein